MQSWIKKNITFLKYGLIVVNIIFMIIAIRAVVNYQTIILSIESVQHEINQTTEQTAYINNFLKPYLESVYAPYFFAHENNQIFPGEKIIKLTLQETPTHTNELLATGSGFLQQELDNHVNLPSIAWQGYFKAIFHTIRRGIGGK